MHMFEMFLDFGGNHILSCQATLYVDVIYSALIFDFLQKCVYLSISYGVYWTQFSASYSRKLLQVCSFAFFFVTAQSADFSIVIRVVDGNFIKKSCFISTFLKSKSKPIYYLFSNVLLFCTKILSSEISFLFLKKHIMLLLRIDLCLSVLFQYSHHFSILISIVSIAILAHSNHLFKLFSKYWRSLTYTSAFSVLLIV
jgi:hypothetical protein